MKLFCSFFTSLESLLNRPQRVFYFCLFFIFVTLIVNGSFYRIWTLNRDFKILSMESLRLKSETEVLNSKIEIAQDPDFIERQAIDRLNMASEGDLIFVFSETEE